MKQKHLNNYMQMLKNFGYVGRFRAEVLRSGLAGYRKILVAHKKGLRPIHRSKE